jgi:regulatory protein
LAEAETDWTSRAQQADRKKFGTDPDASFATLAKRRRFLEYRGFTAEQIKDALNAESETD